MQIVAPRGQFLKEGKADTLSLGRFNAWAPTLASREFFPLA
jgi:hypothetical protein